MLLLIRMSGEMRLSCLKCSGVCFVCLHWLRSISAGLGCFEFNNLNFWTFWCRRMSFVYILIHFLKLHVFILMAGSCFLSTETFWFSSILIKSCCSIQIQYDFQCLNKLNCFGQYCCFLYAWYTQKYREVSPLNSFLQELFCLELI